LNLLKQIPHFFNYFIYLLKVNNIFEYIYLTKVYTTNKYKTIFIGSAKDLIEIVNKVEKNIKLIENVLINFILNRLDEN
jgi:hypothetical protein